MIKKNCKIWIWIENSRLLKALYNPCERTLTIYNENDEIIVKREELNQNQIKKLETIFLSKGAKRIDSRKEPFTCF